MLTHIAREGSQQSWRSSASIAVAADRIIMPETPARRLIDKVWFWLIPLLLGSA